MNIIVVVPSLKISGGVRESLRLLSDINADYSRSCILSMWVSSHAMVTGVRSEILTEFIARPFWAAFEFPVIACKFYFWMKVNYHSHSKIIFTHYTSLPLALFVPRINRYFYVQDLEWKFIGISWLSKLMRYFILNIYNTGTMITANSYLTGKIKNEGFRDVHEFPIWADPCFYCPDVGFDRDIDFVVVLRKGDHKRLDLYLKFIELCREGGYVLAIITPEDEIVNLVDNRVSNILLRPTVEEMKRIYCRSKCFVHLSDHEGFGLPPLEAMGSGCVPVCRDSGGVQAYMLYESLSEYLIPLNVDINKIYKIAIDLVKNQKKLDLLRLDAHKCFESGLNDSKKLRECVVKDIFKSI